MKLLDVNILVYATSHEDPLHPPVAAWFNELMNSGETVALPWHTLLGFLRVSTGSSKPKPLAVNTALDFVQDWLEWDTVWVPEPTPNHFALVAELLRATPRSRLVPDAHLAALAIEHGLTLCSTDVDFRLFKGLRLLNPLD